MCPKQQQSVSRLVLESLLFGLGVAFFVILISYSLRREFGEREDACEAKCRQQVAAAESRAQSFKENGRWTPAGVRQLAASLRPGEIVPRLALAELGIPLAGGIYQPETVRTALATVAQRMEQEVDKGPSYKE